MIGSITKICRRPIFVAVICCNNSDTNSNWITWNAFNHQSIIAIMFVQGYSAKKQERGKETIDGRTAGEFPTGHCETAVAARLNQGAAPIHPAHPSSHTSNSLSKPTSKCTGQVNTIFKVNRYVWWLVRDVTRWEFD